MGESGSHSCLVGSGRAGGSLLIPEHHLGKAVSKAHFQFTSESLAGGGGGEGAFNAKPSRAAKVFLKVQRVNFGLISDFYMDKSLICCP